MGKRGFPISQPLLGAAGALQAGEWGNPVSPYVHLRRSCAWRTTPAYNRGRANPLPNPPPLGEGSGLLPAGRGMGKPGFPISQPLLGAAGALQAGEWGNPVSPFPNRCWERLAPPRTGGWGNAVSPSVHRWGGLAAPRAGEWGNPVSPYVHLRRSCAWRTTPACNRGRANPLSDPPPLGEGSGLLPAGRGVGKPGFPTLQPPLGASGTPTGRGMGNPGFPMFSHQTRCE